MRSNALKEVPQRPVRNAVLIDWEITFKHAPLGAKGF
jgi:hypothetical protein